MKKFILMLAVAMGLSLSAAARDSYTHDPSVLPDAARTTIADNFKAKVSVIKIEKTLGHIDEYEVVLTDGTEISFDSKGNWDNIETSRTSSVPSALLLKNIQDYVTKNHPGTDIIGIDKDKNSFEIELSNGVDLKFDRSGNFLRYDD